MTYNPRNDPQYYYLLPNSSCSKYVLLRPLISRRGSYSNGGSSLKSNVNKENTSVIFFKLHLTKRQKGEKITHKKWCTSNLSILKMFSEKYSLISVSFRTMSHRRGRSHRGRCRVEEQKSHSCRASGQSLAKRLYTWLHFM